MFKKIIIVCGVLLMFMTACGSDKDSSAPAGKDEKATPAAVATAEPTKEAKGSSVLEEVFQPLSMMGGPLLGGSGGSDMQVGSQNVDPELKAALLTADDLPPGYSSLAGDIGYSMDLPEGSVAMAARMFAEDGVMSGGSGSIVMSAVLAMPAAGLEEFDASLAELENMDLSPEGVQKMVGESGMQGIEFKEFKLIKDPGLGESGVGLHMVMDMGGALGGSGTEMGAYQNGIAMDVYMFKRGERVLMVVVMWPAGEQTNADALALAEVMDGRAQ
jgi:hypothetical protein